MKTIFSKTTDKVNISAKISDDKMKLFLDAEPIEQGQISRDELMAIISEFAAKADVNIGVVDDIIKYLHKGEKVEERRIAKGTPAQDGSDGRLLLLLKKFSGKAEVKEDDKGFTDLKSLHLFDNVAKGQAVGRIYAPKEGVDGVDVLGNKVPAKPGKPYKLSTDKTISIQDQKEQGQGYQVMIAEEDGFLFEDSGKITINPELKISGDLDFRYGSIDFIGKVVVNGDVLQGFNIKAGKGIEVRGSVRGGNLVSLGGDIVVKGYVYGGHQSNIISGKSFTAVVVQEINAEIVGDIIIQKEAVDSTLRSETSVYINSGQLVGGECFVVCGVEAKFLGNQAYKETKINFCSDVESHTEYGRLLASIDSHEKAKKMLEMHLGPLAVNPARLQLLNAGHREKMESMYNKLQEVEKSRVSLLNKKKDILEKARVNQTVRANYLDTCYAGVVIQAAGREFAPKENIKGPGSITYINETQEFETGEYKALECVYNLTDNEEEQNEQSKTPV